MAGTGAGLVRPKATRIILGALPHEPSSEATRRRAAEFLIPARTQGSLPELIQRLQYIGESLRLDVMRSAREMVEDRGLTFARTSEDDPLDQTVATVDWPHNALGCGGPPRTRVDDVYLLTERVPQSLGGRSEK
jgi:hypothetical protein